MKFENSSKWCCQDKCLIDFLNISVKKKLLKTKLRIIQKFHYINVFAVKKGGVRKVLTHVLHSLPEMKSILSATYKNAVLKNYDMADCVECEILCKISHSTLSTIL